MNKEIKLEDLLKDVRLNSYYLAGTKLEVEIDGERKVFENAQNNRINKLNGIIDCEFVSLSFPKVIKMLNADYTDQDIEKLDFKENSLLLNSFYDGSLIYAVRKNSNSIKAFLQTIKRKFPGKFNLIWFEDNDDFYMKDKYNDTKEIGFRVGINGDGKFILFVDTIENYEAKATCNSNYLVVTYWEN